jgi:hypothetical protein
VLVTILITNHNYAAYLRDALDGALAQTWTPVEVIVVDDGSTDESRAVLEDYGPRITAILKPRGGQASAVNAGLARARGDVVCMLDADDAFTADKVERVVEAYGRRPDTALVHHQMRTVNSGGVPQDAPWPASLPEGDLAPVLLRTGGWYPRAPMSALSFRRAYLERVGPVPVDPVVADGPRGRVTVEVKADTYLAAPAAFAGSIGAVRMPLTRYRIHGANKSMTGHDGQSGRAALWNRRVAQYAVEHAALEYVLRERLGLTGVPALEDHLERRLHLRGLGDASFVRTVAHVLRTPVMPLSMRIREATRVALGRGWAASVEA